MMPTDQTVSTRLERRDYEIVSAQFDHLIEEPVAGRIQRSRFETWEVDIPLDFLGQSPEAIQQTFRPSPIPESSAPAVGEWGSSAHEALPLLGVPCESSGGFEQKSFRCAD